MAKDGVILRFENVSFEYGENKPIKEDNFLMLYSAYGKEVSPKD